MSEVKIEDIAKLARLHLNQAEIASLEVKFDQIKDYFNQIADVKLPDSQRTNSRGLSELREDVAEKSPIDLSFSPYITDKLFKIPKVIE